MAPVPAESALLEHLIFLIGCGVNHVEAGCQAEAYQIAGIYCIPLGFHLHREDSLFDVAR